MKILIAGPRRSGTTALFNIVRLICQSTGGAVYSCFEDQYEGSEAIEFHHQIVKVHKWYDDKRWVKWAGKIITIHREPSEIWESMQRFGESGGRVFTREEHELGLIHWGKYHKYDCYAAHYNQLNRSTEKLAWEIAKKLRIAIDEKQIIREFRGIKPPKSGIDPVTLLHFNHITKE